MNCVYRFAILLLRLLSAEEGDGLGGWVFVLFKIKVQIISRGGRVGFTIFV